MCALDTLTLALFSVTCCGTNCLAVPCLLQDLVACTRRADLASVQGLISRGAALPEVINATDEVQAVSMCCFDAGWFSEPTLVDLGVGVNATNPAHSPHVVFFCFGRGGVSGGGGCGASPPQPCHHPPLPSPPPLPPPPIPCGVLHSSRPHCASCFESHAGFVWVCLCRRVGEHPCFGLPLKATAAQLVC